MPVVPALHFEYCTECHHSLSTQEYRPLYPLNDSERAFSNPDLSLNPDELISRAKASLVSVEEIYNWLQESLKQLEGIAYIFEFTWRSIALSTPPLWTNIFVGSVGIYSNGAELLSLYLDRSQSLPISLKWETDKKEWSDDDGDTMDVSGSEYDALERKHEALYEQVWDTSNLWARVDLSLDSDDLDAVSMTASLSPAEHLHGSASIRTCAPKLRTVSFWGANLSRTWAYKYFPWAQIDTLTTDMYTPSMARDITNCGFIEAAEPRYQTLILEGKINVGKTIPSVPHNYVSSLILRPDSFTDRLAALLSNLRLPVLEEFILEGKALPSNSDCRCTTILAAIPKLLKKSAPPLLTLKTALDLGGSAPAEESAKAWTHVLEALEQVPSLWTLSIVESATNLAPLLTAPLISTITSQKHIPQLINLELVWGDANSIPMDELGELLDSRLDPPKEFKANVAFLETLVLGVRGGGEVQPRMLDTMRILQNRGDVEAWLW